MTVLVLGGTSEARDLAGALSAEGTRVISSLAGRVERPRLPAGEVRVGGFGGPGALAAWLSENGIAAVVDATHPFAQRISESAATACSASGVPLLRLERPGWTQHSDDDWHWVGDTAEAAAADPRARATGLPDDRPAGARGIRRPERDVVPGPLHRPARAAAPAGLRGAARPRSL